MGQQGMRITPVYKYLRQVVLKIEAKQHVEIRHSARNGSCKLGAIAYLFAQHHLSYCSAKYNLG